MNCLRFVTVFLLLASSVPAQEEPAGWSRKTFSAAPDRVFAAALKSIAAQDHEVKSKDEGNGVVKFHVGTTAWSWGYTMVLKVVPGENNSSNVSVDIARSGGKTFSWGSGKKEVEKIFKGIDKELSQEVAKEPAKTPAPAPSPTAAPATIPVPAVRQEPSQEMVEGITNFHHLGTTVACAGATKPESVPEIKKMGYQSIFNLRQASEPGANVESEAAAAEAAGIRYVHIPFDAGAPDPAAVDKFLDAITTSGSEPAFIHCAAGVRAAMMWFVKRLVVDHWDVDRAEKEAVALGMTNKALKQFALDYAQAHKR
jgi:uncharacterized protein (TIGR01244 family)